MRVAHLSDVHLVASSSDVGYRVRTSAVRFGRSRDAMVRAAKLARALDAVRQSRAEHLVVSGDLTELGDKAELTLFGEVLEAAELPPSAVTLVPGNHDAYSTPDAWAWSLRGPLARWAGTSAPPGGLRVVERGEVVLVAVDTTRPQPLVFSGGDFTDAMGRELERVLADVTRTDRVCLVVTHHPPLLRKDTTMHRLLDTLHGGERLVDLLARHPRAALLHGHFHASADRALPGAPVGSPPRIFGAPGVADDGDAPRVRVYEAGAAGIVALA